MTNLQNKIHNKQKLFLASRIQKKRKRNGIAMGIMGKADEVSARYHHWDESALALFCPRVSSFQSQVSRMTRVTDLDRLHAYAFSQWTTGAPWLPLLQDRMQREIRGCYQQKGKWMLCVSKSSECSPCASNTISRN